MKDIEIVKSLLSSQLGAYDELIYGSKVGNMDIVKSAISKGAKCWNSALLNACRGGNIDIVELMFSMCEKSGLNPDITELSKCLYNACECGHTHIVEYIISKADNKLIWDSGFHGACSGGNLELVEYMISKIEAPEYKNNLKYGFYNACENGHMDVIKYLIYKGGADYWTDGLRLACFGGKLSVAEFMIEKGAEFCHIGFYTACENGNLDIVKLIVSTFNINKQRFKSGLEYACMNGRKDIVEFLIPNVLNLNSALAHACCNGNTEIIDILLISSYGTSSYGACNLNEGICYAYLHRNIETIKFLISKAENRNCLLDFSKCLNLDWNDDKDIIRLLISKGAVSKKDYTNVFETDIKMLRGVLNEDLIRYTVINI